MRAAMREVEPGDADSGPALAPSAKVAEAIEAVARSGAPAARVVDRGRLLGVVDRECLLDVVAGTASGGTSAGGDLVGTAAGPPAGSAAKAEAGEAVL